MDPATREKMHKSLFMVFLSGKDIRLKVLKIGHPFYTNIYSALKDYALQMAYFKEFHICLDILYSIMVTSKSQSI